MAGIPDKIYAASPVWLQQLGITAFGLMWRRRRYGGAFRGEVAAFQAREKYSREQWQVYQVETLRLLLHHAATQVPHYRESFAASGFAPRDFADFSLDDLPRLPLLEKDAIRRAPERFVAQNSEAKKLHTYLTSGTTGTPMEVKMSSRTHQKSAASYEARCRRWAGVDFTLSRVMIGGRIVVPRAESKPPFWRYNAAEKQLYMSAFHISPANAREYSRAINEKKPDYLVGYASSHYFLARLLEEQNIAMHRPRAILTSSEKLTQEMRATLERVYGCEVFDGYSGVEACCLASECEHHRLHLSPDVGLVEILDEDGTPVAAGESGEIVATGFLNLDQPLIRYRTGDMAIASDEACPCGRAMPILQELVGRLEDVVIGRDGREMVRFHGIFVGLPRVREGQIVQETHTDFLLRLAVEPDFGDEDRAIIQARFDERLGPVNIRYEIVDGIERTQRGKFRAVISHVRREASPRN